MQSSVSGRRFTADLPSALETEVYTFADDTAILSTQKSIEKTTKTLQGHLNEIEKWTDSNKIKINTTKCAHITFTLNKRSTPKIKLNNQELPQAISVKYLGLHLDNKLNWKKHIQEKIKQIKVIRKAMYWLTSRKSKLSVKNKLLIYKIIIKPIWTYGLQIWGMAAKSNIKNLENMQSIILRTILNAQWYVRNDDIRKTLGISTVKEEITKRSRAHQHKIKNHKNSLVQDCYSLLPRRLKRKHPVDLTI